MRPKGPFSQGESFQKAGDSLSILIPKSWF